MRDFSFLCLAGALMAMLWRVASVSAEPVTKEYQLKAAMIHNLANSTEWPARAFPSSATPFTVCVMGKGQLAAAVESIQGKTVKGRKVVLKQIGRVEDARGGHILVLDDMDGRRAKRVLDTLYLLGNKILTVSDLPSFTHQGGMVGFFKQGGAVKIEINQKEASQANIRFSSHLLDLAKAAE